MRDAANAALEIYGAKRSFVSFFSPTAVNKIGEKFDPRPTLVTLKELFYLKRLYCLLCERVTFHVYRLREARKMTLRSQSTMLPSWAKRTLLLV